MASIRLHACPAIWLKGILWTDYDVSQNKEDKEKLETHYQGLKSTANKRLCCLDDIAQIAGLEELFGVTIHIYAQYIAATIACVHDSVSSTTLCLKYYYFLLYLVLLFV